MAYDYQDKSREAARRAGVGRHAGGVDQPQMTPGDPDQNAIGNRVHDKDPRGTYGEHQSEPTNILGERAQPKADRGVTGGSAGQFPANRLPDRAAFEVPTAWKGIQPAPDPVPGAGVWDQAARDVMDPIAPYGVERARRQHFDQMLTTYVQFAGNIETLLLELRALDPARFDGQFTHLAKVNLPRPVPDPNLQPGFTTMEAALLRRGTQPPAQLPRGVQEVPPQFHPDHPDYVPPTEEQKLLPYQEGGYAGMSDEMARAYRVPLSEVRKANEASKVVDSCRSMPFVPPPSAPQPWK